MIKSILEVQEIEIIQKDEQKDIMGTGDSGSCTGTGNRCCVTTSSGFEFCDAGRCISGRYCLWY